MHVTGAYTSQSCVPRGLRVGFTGRHRSPADSCSISRTPSLSKQSEKPLTKYCVEFSFVSPKRSPNAMACCGEMCLLLFRGRQGGNGWQVRAPF